MLKFKSAELDDLKTVNEYLSSFNDYSCENTVSNILVWQNHFGFAFCEFENMLFTKVKYGKNEVFGLPAARNMKKAVGLLKEYCKQKNIPLIFTAAEGERLDLFKRDFEKEFLFAENRDLFEYVYNTSDLSTLAGKKYHSKRNHISSFMKKYNWSYDTLTAENVGIAYAMTEEWYNQNSDKMDRFMKIERDGVKKIFDNYGKLNVIGGILSVDGKAVAVTFGTAVNSNVFDVSYEKALKGYDGAYAMINNRFVLSELQSYSLVNREDDMGLEGLRKAKLSYKPAVLLKKYLIKEETRAE